MKNGMTKSEFVKEMKSKATAVQDALRIKCLDFYVYTDGEQTQTTEKLSEALDAMYYEYAQGQSYIVLRSEIRLGRKNWIEIDLCQLRLSSGKWFVSSPVVLVLDGGEEEMVLKE